MNIKGLEWKLEVEGGQSGDYFCWLAVGVGGMRYRVETSSRGAKCSFYPCACGGTNHANESSQIGLMPTIEEGKAFFESHHKNMILEFIEQ